MIDVSFKILSSTWPFNCFDICQFIIMKSNEMITSIILFYSCQFQAVSIQQISSFRFHSSSTWFSLLSISIFQIHSNYFFVSSLLTLITGHKILNTFLSHHVPFVFHHTFDHITQFQSFLYFFKSDWNYSVMFQSQQMLVLNVELTF